MKTSPREFLRLDIEALETLLEARKPWAKESPNAYVQSHAQVRRLMKNIEERQVDLAAKTELDEALEERARVLVEAAEEMSIEDAVLSLADTIKQLPDEYMGPIFDVVDLKMRGS